MLVMSSKIDTLLEEVRNMPGFVAAAATDAKWLEELEAVERALNTIERLADEDPNVLEIFDKVQTAIDRRDLSLKKRLFEVGRLLTELRVNGRTVN
jgi:hypothetical protein